MEANWGCCGERGEVKLTQDGGNEGEGQVSRNHGGIAEQEDLVAIFDGALRSDAGRGRQERLRHHDDRCEQRQLRLGHHLLHNPKHAEKRARKW